MTEQRDVFWLLMLCAALLVLWCATLVFMALAGVRTGL